MSMMCCMLALTPRQMKILRARPGLTVALSSSHFDEGGVDIQEAAALDEADQEEDADAPIEEDSEEDDGDDDGDEEEDEDEDEDIDLSTVFDEPVRKTLELEKSWDVLRVLLEKFEAKDKWANALLAGNTIGGDVGYGEASLRGATATEQFARFLQTVDLDQLLSRVNYPELLEQELYAFPDEDQLREDLSHHYPRLRDYVARAAAAKHGLLIWLE